MQIKYFEDIQKQLIKKPAKKTAAKPGSKTKLQSAKTAKPSSGAVLQAFKKLVPSSMTLDKLNIIDTSGYIVESSDFVAYKKYCEDIVEIMGGYIPSELVYGTYQIFDSISKKNLANMIKLVSQVKRLNHFTEKTDQILIPSFVIAYNTDYKLPDLKSELVDSYMNMSLDGVFEVDIIAVLNKGLIIKDWREKRKFVALETGQHTLMWFFILMNEYLDVNKGENFDLRNYVKHNEKYNEY